MDVIQYYVKEVRKKLKLRTITGFRNGGYRVDVRCSKCGAGSLQTFACDQEYHVGDVFHCHPGHTCYRCGTTLNGSTVSKVELGYTSGSDHGFNECVMMGLCDGTPIGYPIPVGDDGTPVWKEFRNPENPLRIMDYDYDRFSPNPVSAVVTQ